MKWAGTLPRADKAEVEFCRALYVFCGGESGGNDTIEGKLRRRGTSKRGVAHRGRSDFAAA
jgi:hypothetical protein